MRGSVQGGLEGRPSGAEARPSHARRGRSGLRCLAGCACLLGWGILVPDPAVPGREPGAPLIQRTAPLAGGNAGQDDRALKRRLDMTEVEILGEVEKPRTLFVIPRAPHQYSWESDTIDFSQEILAPMTRRRIEGLQQWRDESTRP